jgi:hypothetical protein
LEDWKIEKIDDQKMIFYKGKQYIPKDQELQRDILKLFHNHETARHPEELETWNNITGGQGLKSLSKTMSKDAESANNSRLTKIHHAHLSYQ